MLAFLTRLLLVAQSRLKSQAPLEAKIWLCQQVVVLNHQVPVNGAAAEHRSADLRLAVPILPHDSQAIIVVKPET
jgi:hypothetical protein